MAATGAERCFHCGEPAPAGARYSAVIDGAARIMCCAGCAAVARTIAGHGLTAYYASREGTARRAAPQKPGSDYAAYDLAEVQRPFVCDAGTGAKQATLLAEGVTCGACAWLIERGVQRLAGVRSVAVNVAAHRVQVEWDDSRTHLSAILEAIAALGYGIRGFDPAAGERAAAHERRTMLWRLFVAGFAMMQVMMYAVPAYVSDGDMTPEAEQLMRWASLALTVPVMLWSAGPWFVSACRELTVRRLGMDLPVAIGLAVAFAASAWATLSGHGVVYFDSITMFVFLLLGARYLEAAARAKATESQRRLAGHIPAVADRVVGEAGSGVTERVAVAQLVPGDLVQVVPGATIPADGSVTTGWSAVDESLLTGEARPVGKGPGDAVVGGSVNIASPLTLRVARVGAETVLYGIVRLMDRAQAGKPRLAQLADRVGRWFVVSLMAMALATGAAWCWIDPQRALQVTVAVLVVSCPCALSLATPAALAAATGALHRMGILVTRGHALETLARVTHVVFDKTGTLTLGRLSLVGIVPLGLRSRKTCLSLAAALERGSEHPVARAIVAAAAGLAPDSVTDVRNQPGRGIEGCVNGLRVRIGSPAFVAELVQGLLPPQLAYTADEVTVVTLADERGYLALFALDDEPRPGARWVTRELEASGKQVLLLSGDRRSAVTHVAGQLGIAAATGEADPGMKLAFVRALQAQGGVVAVVGDGVNDAPVIAQAQVSIAMGGGIELARTGADMVLLADDLSRLVSAFDTARKAMRIVRQNLAWAAAYNAVAVPLAMTGAITPLSAGIGMALSSLAVVLNALRLQGEDCPEGKAAGRELSHISATS